MSHNTHCLNCNEAVSQKFCPNCGQKTDTHRITFKHLVFHDIIHGVWHFEKGILFTLKEAITRPGKAALDYIEGKRIRYYNVFYLALILIGLNIFVLHYYDILAKEYMPQMEKLSNEVDKLDVFFENYSKLLLLGLLPLFAFNSFVLFKKRKLNFSEHVIISGMLYLGILLISAVMNVFLYFDFTEKFVFISDFANILTPILLVAYVLFAYYNTFGDYYKKWVFLPKITLFIALLAIEVIIFILLLKFILVGK
jgi:hypothetical protein